MLNLLILLLLGVIFLPSTLPQVPPPNSALPSQQGLAHLLFTSPIMALNPQVSVACFTDYIAHLNVAGEGYSRDYKICLLEAKEERKQIDVEAMRERHNIVDATEAVCSSLRTCNAKNNTMELFHCHSRIGGDNTKFTYAISGNASEYASILQERYRLIDLHHQQCCHRAERIYVSTTADNYSHLQACLEGRVKPRPPLTTTTIATEQPTTSSTTTTAAATNTTSTSFTATAPSSTTTTTKANTTEAPSELVQQTTTPPSPPPSEVSGESITTTQPNQGIQAQIGQFLN